MCQPAAVSKHWANHPNTKLLADPEKTNIARSISNSSKQKINNRQRQKRILENKNLTVKTNNGQFIQINSKENMISYLEKNPNIYNSFILSFCL
jgi:hypothetical protein